MSRKSKDVAKKLPPTIIRPVISESSLVYLPEDVVEGFQERIETGIAWTLINLAARHHKQYRDQEVPIVKFTEALQNKIKSSMLSGFLDPDSTLSLQQQFEVIVPITIWDNEKFSTEEGKTCFNSDNSLTDDIMKLLKKVVRLDDRELLIKELRRVPILRLLDTKMTELDQDLLKFKNLTTLNLCGNFISKLDAACLPRCLRVLELQSNYIKSVEEFADNLPENLMYLGLSSNFLANEGIEFLSKLPRSIRILDLSDNDICTLELVLEALAPLPGLRGLLLAGNPCAMCAAYSQTALSRLPLIRWLDAREVFPSDRPEDPYEPHPDDLRSAYFTFGVIRIMSTPQPPKPEKGVTTSFHVELELPLLDASRRAFLMFRRNESLVEFLPPPEDDEWTPSKSRQSSIGPSKALIDEETATHESNIYQHLVAKNSREIVNFKIFETNKIQWNKSMNFQDPAVKIFCPDLKTLRDTFRSEITLRFVYTMIFPPSKLGKVDKKSLPLLKPPPSEQRVVLATVKCALRRPDWSQPQQHFHWDDSLETHDAIHWGDGDLAILESSRSRCWLDHGGISSDTAFFVHQTLQYANTLVKLVTGKSKSVDVSGRMTIPDNLTCHFAFGIEPLPQKK